MDRSVIQSVVEEYKLGATPSSLAEKWGVHPTTILRWIKKELDIKPKISNPSNMDKVSRLELRKLLVNLNLDNVDLIIRELDSNFDIKLKQTKDEDFEVILVK